MATTIRRCARCYKRLQLCNLGAQVAHLFRDRRARLLLLVEDRAEELLRPGLEVLLAARRLDEQADELFGGVEPAPEVVVLARLAVEERVKVVEARALDLAALRDGQEAGLAGAHAYDV